MGFKTFSPCRNLMAMSRLINDLRAKENEIIYESGNERGAIRIRVQNKSNQQKRSKNPGKPFDFDGQNKKDVDDLVGIKSRKCEEQRCDQHPVRKFRSERSEERRVGKECRSRRSRQQ